MAKLSSTDLESSCGRAECGGFSALKDTLRVATKDSSSRSSSTEAELPFGAMAPSPSKTVRKKKRSTKKSGEGDSKSAEPKPSESEPSEPKARASSPPEKSGESKGGGGEADSDGDRPRRNSRSRRRRRSRNRSEEQGSGSATSEPREGEARSEGGNRQGGPSGRRRRNRRRRGEGGGERERERGRGGEREPREASGEIEGILVLEKGNHGELRVEETDWQSKKSCVHVSPRWVQKYQLRDGALVKGKYGRGHGKHKFDLLEVETVDGKPPEESRNLPTFKNLTSITPDFHYAVGDSSGEVSLQIVDLLCPVGRGQRGLIVAPPRSGKTVLLQQFAKAVEQQYPDVHLIVLLVDERPEEATEWRRTIEHGQVFVSTNDEMPKKHVELAEVVWRRCCRLVELGEDVIVLMDSITRLARAYNHVRGNSGKTMSGGIDARTMERPKQFFGSARNTETAGSLTILGTTLVETGSRMDQVIFEEFKGTGNMELVLSRKLADRRIFPAIDIERSGTRKEEKMISSRRLRLIHTLRRVLQRMHWAEAMELLVTKLEEVGNTEDFLKRFEIDPDED